MISTSSRPLVLAFCFLATAGPPNAEADDEKSTIPETAKSSVNGRVDHVLVTLPSKQFAAVQSYSSEHLIESWISRDRHRGRKAFIFTRRNKVYVELWDSGKMFRGGHQVALSASGKQVRDKVEEYFGVEGVQGRSVFTAGGEGAIGHPVGGTFFVSYSDSGEAKPREKGVISEFVGVITAVPPKRMVVVSDYEFFGFTIRRRDNGFVATDSAGFTVQVAEVPWRIPMMSFGHVALHFRLAEPSSKRIETNLLEDGSVKTVMDGRDFWLVLHPGLFQSIAENFDG